MENKEMTRQREMLQMDAIKRNNFNVKVETDKSRIRELLRLIFNATKK